MENIRMDSLADYNDIATLGQYDRALKAGMNPKEAFDIVAKRSRDNSRTPMQWNRGKNAGFSEAERTWIKVNTNCDTINVEMQETDTESVLKFYQNLIHLRRASKYSYVIVNGTFAPYYVEDDCVIAYKRITVDRQLLVIHNFQNRMSMVELPEGYEEMVIGNYGQAVCRDGHYSLKPYECITLYKTNGE